MSPDHSLGSKANQNELEFQTDPSISWNSIDEVNLSKNVAIIHI